MAVRHKILRHLQAGHTLTGLQAMQEYGTMSLPYHIYKLRQEGWNIRTRMKTNFNGQRHAEYFLVEE